MVSVASTGGFKGRLLLAEVSQQFCLDCRVRLRRKGPLCGDNSVLEGNSVGVCVQHLLQQGPTGKWCYILPEIAHSSVALPGDTS